MKVFWKIYFVFVLIYKIIVAVSLSQTSAVDIAMADILYVIFFIGLFGFAFHYRILVEKVWKWIFVAAVILYIHTWIVMPLVLVFSKNLAIIKVMNILLFSVPLIPLIFALYFYAWRSSDMWKNGSNRSNKRQMGEEHELKGETKKSTKLRPTHLVALILLIFFFFIFKSAVYTVGAGDIAIVTKFGKISGEPREPGFYFKIPAIHKVHYYSITRLYSWDGYSYIVYTSDKANVEIIPSAMWRISDPIRFFKTVYKIDTSNARLSSIVPPIMKSVFATFHKNEIIGQNAVDNFIILQRKDINEKVKNAIEPPLGKFGIKIHDLNLKIKLSSTSD